MAVFVLNLSDIIFLQTAPHREKWKHSNIKFQILG